MPTGPSGRIFGSRYGFPSSTLTRTVVLGTWFLKSQWIVPSSTASHLQLHFLTRAVVICVWAFSFLQNMSSLFYVIFVFIWAKQLANHRCRMHKWERCTHEDSVRRATQSVTRGTNRLLRTSIMKVMNLQPGRHHEYQCVLRRVARGCVPLDGHAFQGTNDVSKIKRISFLTLDFQICFFLNLSAGGNV